MLFYCWSTPGSPNIRQTGLVSLPLSVSFPPLFLANPTPHPPYPFPSPPHKSYCIWVTAAFNPLCHSSTYPKPFVLVSGPESLSVISPVCVLSQPACLHPDWPHIKAGNQRPMWDQMFLLRLANEWSPPHSSLADRCCLCLATLQKAWLNELQTLASSVWKPRKSRVRC